MAANCACFLQCNNVHLVIQPTILKQRLSGDASGRCCLLRVELLGAEGHLYPSTATSGGQTARPTLTAGICSFIFAFLTQRTRNKKHILP